MPGWGNHVRASTDPRIPAGASRVLSAACHGGTVIQPKLPSIVISRMCLIARRTHSKRTITTNSRERQIKRHAPPGGLSQTLRQAAGRAVAAPISGFVNLRKSETKRQQPNSARIPSGPVAKFFRARFVRELRSAEPEYTQLKVEMRLSEIPIHHRLGHPALSCSSHTGREKFATGPYPEVRLFRDLQGRLPQVFQSFSTPEAPRTVLIVPSLSLDRRCSPRSLGVHHYEERMPNLTAPAQVLRPRVPGHGPGSRPGACRWRVGAAPRRRPSPWRDALP